MSIRNFFSRLKAAILHIHLWMRIKYYFLVIFYPIKRIVLAIKHSAPLISPVRSSAHWVLWSTCIFILIFLLWSKFAVLEEVTTASGTVIPLTHVQIVQNMEGGIIKQLYVHEGDIVEKGQLLLTLEPARFISALDEARARSTSLQIKIARLNAETTGDPFTLPPEIENSKDQAIQAQIKGEKELYVSRQAQVQQMQQNVTLAEQELTMTRPLVNEGAASPVEVLHLQRQILDLKNQIDQFHSRTLDDLATGKADLATLKAAMLALQDRVSRTTIRSTQKGVIKQIRIATIGSVVQPGAEIMSIVPIEDTLLVEAEVKPADIGFIHLGQEVQVKVTAYDSSVYGALEGYVDRVSADTITDAKGKSYYLVRIKTDKNYLRTASNPLYIIPGMTASVSILTGRRTVLNYLLSPLIKARDSALRER